MRMKYLGDSYDVVKRSLLAGLAGVGPWLMHPMLTEADDVEHLAHLERMIGADALSSALLTSKTDRQTYFAACASAGHLFIDPNTGLRIKRITGKRAPDFLFLDELVELAKARPGALTIVFDQSLSRASRLADLKNKLHHLREHGLTSFAYDSHACFVISGYDGLLVDRARMRLIDALGLPECRLLTVDGS